MPMLTPPNTYPGQPRIVTGTTPAAGTQAVLAVTAGRVWRVLSLRVSLTTSIAVATRRMHIQVIENEDLPLDVYCLATQTASLSRNYTCSAIGYSSAVSGDSENLVGLPGDLLITEGMSLTTAVSSIQGTDQVSAIQVLVEEWEIKTSSGGGAK